MTPRPIHLALGYSGLSPAIPAAPMRHAARSQALDLSASLPFAAMF